MGILGNMFKSIESGRQAAQRQYAERDSFKANADSNAAKWNNAADQARRSGDSAGAEWCKNQAEKHESASNNAYRNM